ncbi:hypothetical protein HBI70_178200 [Parastagonospora nodorum]|nr:hypothetical protein HBI10_172700 [Parastagonospora nodorum]KAH4016158.1 hypothetical protein HBI13_154060 [Parastagonospora nodorum]KAH4805730.1 hypothetical protein HBH61_156120 [Parastagonospora nodorum]KAH5087122.1 hypothetical protein HBI73_150360 [Parastagonospora nodorum]KAH5186175.1 hypothetical protein HBH68_166670 [Parastagonospora nodorum]
MTAPLRSTPHSTALPASQTAPVAEFRCLFTHDVRRKQKRWQDGYLKFHTFNNRVMVTDQARNHIGDTYWKESNELQEGDELSLDKGVLVEVAEAMGITQTDLASVVAKKKDTPKEPLARPTPSASTRPFQRPTSVAPSNVARTGAQLRHKSLNTLLGTPKGPVGKAMPMKSPYESRMEKQKENDLAEERAPKRQKIAEHQTGWRASSPVHGDESSPVKRVPLWAKTADARTVHAPHAAISRPSKAITISSESDPSVISSDVTLPSTPAKPVESVPAPLLISASVIRSSELAEPATVPLETPKATRPRIPLPKKKSVETPKRPAPNSSPPVSASNRLMNVDFAVQPVQAPEKKPSPAPSPPRVTKGKALRLSTGVKRGTLLCQTISRPASRSGSELRASSSRSNNSKVSRIRSKDSSPAILEERIIEQRSDGLVPSRSPPAKKAIQRSGLVEHEVNSKTAEDRTTVLSPQAPGDVFDDPEITYGLMDQQLLIASSPAETNRPPLSPVIKPPVMKSIARGVVEEKPKAQPPEREDQEVVATEPIEPKPPVSKKAKKQTAKKATETPQTMPPLSPTVQPVLKPPEPRSRDISPAHTDTYGARSRTSSTSSAKKHFSTGGFPKRAKRIAKESAATTPIAEAPALAPAPPEEPVALPPYPLRSGKKEQLMSTTELAALLTKPRKRTRAEDPIEDDPPPTGKSPARKMRRVRSENDAPIPSTADDWEKRNLPRTSSDQAEVEDLPAPALAPALKKKSSGLAALVKRTDPRKKFQRTQSLNVETNLAPVDEPDLPSPVIDTDVGPWSTEAFDLFDWRPPGREEVVT